MSLKLLNQYETNLSESIRALRDVVNDDKSMSSFLKTTQDPPEYKVAQDLLRQMEIESMNFMGSQEYSKNLRDGDLIRKKIQRFKKDLDQIRKTMRQK